MMNGFIFETNWGWAAAVVDHQAVRNFYLPVPSKKQAQTWLQEQNITNQTSPRYEKLKQKLIKQVSDFFNGKSMQFQLPFSPAQTTTFRKKVYKALCQIPAGETTTYAELATLAGSPRAARAVGSAMAANPLPLLIPCHRVIGCNGKTGGFTAPGGPEYKLRLQNFETQCATAK